MSNHPDPRRWPAQYQAPPDPPRFPRAGEIDQSWLTFLLIVVAFWMGLGFLGLWKLVDLALGAARAVFGG